MLPRRSRPAEAAALYPRIEGREVDDVIVALRQHVESVAGATAAADPAVAEAVRRITQALLHAPDRSRPRGSAGGRAGALPIRARDGVRHHRVGSARPAMSTGGAA